MKLKLLAESWNIVFDSVFIWIIQQKIFAYYKQLLGLSSQ
jgi:hypothetical protein